MRCNEKLQGDRGAVHTGHVSQRRKAVSVVAFNFVAGARALRTNLMRVAGRVVRWRAALAEPQGAAIISIACVHEALRPTRSANHWTLCGRHTDKGKRFLSP